ncbi:MAG: hypothetical protein COV67_05565 [Nitrospinae bacterium CG11_big_fil_rev_8_21_14_0_20_56_8]|nr:MAG: hypothetical protein COV67_05565 [Nitrospinae bacterium CG11_big_fil_rev_8_21_14_0_20_56_8]
MFSLPVSLGGGHAHLDPGFLKPEEGMSQSIVTFDWEDAGMAAVGAAVFLLTYYLIRRRRGRMDQRAVYDEIRALGGEYQMVHDVLALTGQGLCQIDPVVVSPYGVFVVTWNCAEGTLSGRERDSEWVLKKGRRNETIRNPLWENRRQVNALRDLAGDLPLFSLVVFVNARLGGNLGPDVVTLRRMRSWFQQHQKTALSPDRRETFLRTVSRAPKG